MNEIAQIRKLSLWIFFVPFISINLCLLISVNPDLFVNTILEVDQIGRSGFTIPYFDGSLSISRASRTYPQYLIFKPAMFITGVLLIIYWKSNNILISKFYKLSNKNFLFKNFGIFSAILLILHSIFLGIEFDNIIIKILRRVVLLGFIICEIAAQSLLVINLYKLRDKIEIYSSKKILNLKIILVSIMVLVAILVSPILNKEELTHLKHGLEWNYFIGIILFYLLTRFFWRRTT